MPRIKVCLISNNGFIKNTIEPIASEKNVVVTTLETDKAIDDIDPRFDGALIDLNYPVKEGIDLARNVQFKLGKEGLVAFVNPETPKEEIAEILQDFITQRRNNIGVSAKMVEDYKNTIPEKLTNLENHLIALLKNKTPEDFTAFRTDVHKMAGSAGLFGYKHVSLACKEFEKFLVENQASVTASPNEAVLREYISKVKEEF